ncbi:DNA-protecting protein DprA [Romboutsia weinsteinii]|uniref:DNA-protecting protein DprA n=1 Tax=Romboutsia weinsteinii TaxID=2020949 RepID=A0A371J7N5_9FIRM|nr:DNA-processing protein DprA [Romboutsia weinsteinii]RDY28790.1 DNA-protecting protein DprA [Romboutsia weinsteinii]
MESKDIYLWLKSMTGMTNRVIENIAKNIGDIENLFDISDKEIYNLENINLNIKENIVKYKSHSYLDNIKEELYKKDVKYVSIADKDYPSNLKYIHNAPKLLFYKGNLSIASSDLKIAMVGSRKPTAYGINSAKTISKQLSNEGVNIISGLAIGIDSYSHEGCMLGNSKTIAVFGSSVDNPLPRKNVNLSNKILDNGGLILSEYNINSVVIPSNFPSRNRIISGISDGVIVVEAASKSGALITVEFALEQGKNVFAVPGNINSEMSRGCHKIIKEGAKLIENTEDILNEYNIISINSEEIGKNYDNIELNAQTIKIIEAIKHEGCVNIDSICDYTGLGIKSVNAILGELTLNDIVLELNNKTYSLNV